MTIEELVKENAELKQNVINLENDREIFLSDFYCDKKGTCKLTKAKDYILKLTTYLEGHTNYDFEYELIKEVKQFLNSEVEK